MRTVLYSEQIKSRVISLIEALPADGTKVVIVEKVEPSRSLAQNRLMWMWLGVFGDDVGMTKQEAHDAMCEHILGTTKVKCLDGREVDVVAGTSGLGVKGMADFLDRVESTAAGLGVVLPHPEDIYYKAMGYV